METRMLGIARWPVGLAGAVMIASLFLPWSDGGTGSANAWELNAGVATLVLAAGLIALAAAATNGTTGLFRPDLSMSAAADMIAVITAAAVIVLFLDLPSGAGAGTGVFLALAATVVISGCCGDYRVFRGAPAFPRSQGR